MANTNFSSPFPDYVFPALDVLRVVIKCPEGNGAFCVNSNLLNDMLKYWAGESAAPNQILSLKVVCNMFAQPQGFKLCMENRDHIISTALALKKSANKNVQIALSTLLLNFAVGLFGSLDLEGKSQVLSAAVECLTIKPDPEAAFRLSIAMGTLIHKDEMVLNLAQSMNLQSMLGDYMMINEPKKISDCVMHLKELLR